MVKLLPMNMALFQQELYAIDENYPLSIPPSAILTVQVVMGVTLLTALIIAIWQVGKRKKNLSTLFKVAPEIKNIVTANSDRLMNSLKLLLSTSSNPPADVEAPLLETLTATDTPTTPNVSSMIPALPPCNQVPPLSMQTLSVDSLTPDVVEKLFQVYQQYHPYPWMPLKIKQLPTAKRCKHCQLTH